MAVDTDVKKQVREFYNQVGWREVSEGMYQNAHYEDLRPISREYIHRCHLRVNRHLRQAGKYLLDAGSGPIQYPEYLEYSRDYSYRVCADISIVALQEARKRIREHGLFVVADIANLPFKSGIFDGVVSLHTLHHLPMGEHCQAYLELNRVLTPGSTAVVVNGWDTSPLMTIANGPIWLVEKLYRLKRGLTKQGASDQQNQQVININSEKIEVTSDFPDQWVNPKRKKRRNPRNTIPKGTFVQKHNASWLKREIGSMMPVQIYVWRSVSVRFLRDLIHDRWGGRRLLQYLYWLEERFPHFLGNCGQYPLIVIEKKRS